MLGENKEQDKNESVYKLVSKLADTPGRATSSWLYLGSRFQRHTQNFFQTNLSFGHTESNKAKTNYRITDIQLELYIHKLQPAKTKTLRDTELDLSVSICRYNLYLYHLCL